MAREMYHSNRIACARMRATAFKRSRPDAGFGHGLIRKSLCHVSKPKHQRSAAWARSLAPSIGALISALITVLSTVFRKEKWRIVGVSFAVLFSGTAEGFNLRRPSAAQTRLGVLYGSGTAVVISRSAEPQMQRTSMFF
jgi:hypothetical protein